MRNLVKSSTIILLSGLMGCSLHPLPENFTRDNTAAIVRKIRCELKETLTKRVLNVLDDYTDQRTLLTAKQIRNGRDIGKLDISDMNKDSSGRILRFKDSTISMEFTFTITEVNANSINATFTAPFTKDTLSIGVKAGKDATRKGVRQFKINDSFGNVAKFVKCENHVVHTANFVYPLTGKIGLAEVVDTFVDIATQVKNENGKGATLGTFTDTLTFTTVLSSVVTPKFVIAPVSKKLKLSEIEGEFGPSRTDEHAVIITLNLPVPEKPETRDIKIKLADNAVLTITAPVRIIRVGAVKPTAQRKNTRPSGKIFDTSPARLKQILENADFVSRREKNDSNLADISERIVAE